MYTVGIAEFCGVFDALSISLHDPHPLLKMSLFDQLIRSTLKCVYKTEGPYVPYGHPQSMYNLKSVYLRLPVLV